MAFKAPSPGAKPKANVSGAKFPGRATFVLGSRPDALRAPGPSPVQRIKPAGASQRQYGKTGGGNIGNQVQPFGTST